MKHAVRRLFFVGLALTLTGCGLIGGESTEAERQAERLRTPPDVLSDQRSSAETAAQTESAADEDTASVDDAGSRAALADAEPADRGGESYLRSVDGTVVLDLGLPPDAGWAILGRALDRSGFALVESDDEAGTHLIRYDTNAVIGIEDDEAEASDDDRSVLERLAFWRDEPAADVQRFQLRVDERGRGSRVSVETPAGDPAPRRAARQVLAVVAEQLKP